MVLEDFDYSSLYLDIVIDKRFFDCQHESLDDLANSYRFFAARVTGRKLEESPVELDIKHEDLQEVMQNVIKKYSSLNAPEEFTLDWTLYRFRILAMKLVAHPELSLSDREELYVFTLRKQPVMVQTLDELGVNSIVQNKLVRPKQTGLILIGGAYGSGKTTIGASALNEMLIHFGGVAFSAEDPVEIPLPNKIGSGVFYQTEVQDGNFSKRIRSLARGEWNYLFVGEIRDSEAAYQAVKAALNGLVITTIHGNDPVSSIQKLIHYLTETLSEGGAHQIVADSLNMVLHQHLQKLDNGIFPKLQFLDVNDYDVVKGLIRDKRLNKLTEEVARQKNEASYAARQQRE